jgi:hypothetical protein
VRRYDMLQSEDEPVLDTAGLAVLDAAARARPTSRRYGSSPRRRPIRAPLPRGQLDQDLQQVDLRDRNSWRFLLAEVSTVELLETQLVNAVAPFVLNAG